jgi:hypothetical protein
MTEQAEWVFEVGEGGDWDFWERNFLRVLGDVGDGDLLDHRLFDFDGLNDGDVLDDFVGLWNFDGLCDGDLLDDFDFLDDFHGNFDGLDDFDFFDDLLDDWNVLDDLNFLDDFD